MAFAEHPFMVHPFNLQSSLFKYIKKKLIEYTRFKNVICKYITKWKYSKFWQSSMKKPTYLKSEVPWDCGLRKFAGKHVAFVADCKSIFSLYHLNYWEGEKLEVVLQWKWFFFFMFCNPEVGTMYSNEMCKKANWFASIPEWGILSCDEKQAPCDYGQSCMPCCLCSCNCLYSSCIYLVQLDK